MVVWLPLLRVIVPLKRRPSHEQVRALDGAAGAAAAAAGPCSWDHVAHRTLALYERLTTGGGRRVPTAGS